MIFLNIIEGIIGMILAIGGGIVVTTILQYIINPPEKKPADTIHVNKKNNPKISSPEELLEVELSKCSYCNGTGSRVLCSVCWGYASIEGVFNEYYDGDAYCPKCRKSGLPDDNIIEEICTFCGGSGKSDF